MKTFRERSWEQHQLATLKGGVGYVETIGPDGDVGIGTCFHVGEGVFVTARHVVEGRSISGIGFDDQDSNEHIHREANRGIREIVLPSPNQSEIDESLADEARVRASNDINIVAGPYFKGPESADVACFRINLFPKTFLPLGRHIGNRVAEYGLDLEDVLILGYPPIPLSHRPVLVAVAAQINAVIQKYTERAPYFWYPYFIVSAMARGGFSGAPVIFPCAEEHAPSGAAVLGLVTSTLMKGDHQIESGFMSVLTVDAIYFCLELSGLLPRCQGFVEFSDEIYGDGNFENDYSP